MRDTTVTVRLTVTANGQSDTDDVEITVTRVPTPCEWTQWAATGRFRCNDGRREREESHYCLTNQGLTEERWVDIGAVSWGDWTFVRYEGCGQSRVRVESRTTSYSSYNCTETRGVDDAQPETWGRWTDTGSTRARRLAYRRRNSGGTSNCENTQTRWVDDPQPETWGDWVDTGEVSGTLDARSKKQKRTSNCDNVEYQWVPVMTEWGPWERTGDYQGCGPSREAKEERINNFGDVDVQWVPAPEPDPPGPWSDTGNHRGCGPDREKEQTRTYKCGRTEARWVAAAEEETWGDWVDTGEVVEPWTRAPKSRSARPTATTSSTNGYPS